MRTVALCCALIAACTASSEDVRPPPDELFFPSGLAVAGNVLFVANSNSELRYDSGTISVIDLTVVDTTIDKWVSDKVEPEGCSPDPAQRETLVCDEAQFINVNAGVRIGNFATDIALQDFSTPGVTRLRVFVPTRGDPSIAWADYDGTRLSCIDDSSNFPLCDDAHRLASVRNDPEDPIQDEPFGVFAVPAPGRLPSEADRTRGFVLVTHLSSRFNGAVTLIDAPSDGEVQVADVARNVFVGEAGGLTGATGVAAIRPEPDGDDIVYVGSRSDNRIQTFTVARPVNETPPYLLRGNFFVLNGVGNNSGVGDSSDTRGIHSPDGKRLYAVNRRPPTLQVIDTSLGPTGVPRNVTTGASDICRQASTVVAVDLGADVGERAYVTCFQDGEVYVVDPLGQSQVEDIVTVGRGPYAIAASPQRMKLFVSNFLEDSIAVIDINPMSQHRNRVVLRIGGPGEP